MFDCSVVDLDGPHAGSQALNTEPVEIVDLDQCDSVETVDTVEIVDVDQSGMVSTDCMEVVDVDRLQVNKESVEEVAEIVVLDDEASFEYFGCARIKVVGLRHYNGTIHVGEMIVLRRDPTNKHDENAIQAINMERAQIGHVNRKAAKVLAPILDHMNRVKIDASTPDPPIRARNGTIYDVVARLDFYGAPEVFEEVKKKLNAPPACIELDEVPERFGGTGISAIGVARELLPGGFNSQKEMEQLYDRLAAEVKSFDFEEPSDFGLVSKLYPHQRQAVAWMLKKERQRPTKLSPLWTEKRERGKTVFYSRITNSSYMERPEPIRGGLVADEMGLGKTIQIIALILANPPTKGIHATKVIINNNQGSKQDDVETPRTKKKAKKSKKGKPSKSAATEELSVPSLGTKTTLIVCPLSVMHNWSQQIKTHTKSGLLNVCVYYGPNRQKDPRLLEQFDVVLATYATLTNEWAAEESWNEKLEVVKKRKREPLGLPHCKFWRVVLDEAHQIRNPKTKTAKAVYALRAVNRWALTGTPVQNKLADMGSLLTFLRVEPLSSSRVFKQAISRPVDRGDPAGFSRLRTIVASVCLRRTKDSIPEIAASLPEKQIELVRVQMTKEQRDLYDMYYSAAKRVFALAMTAGAKSVSSNFGNILEVLLRLRQMCCAPCLVPPGLLEAAREVLKRIDKYQVGPDKEAVILPEQAKKLFEILAGRLRSSEDRFCAVCLEEVTEDSVRINRLCSHSFCEECLSNLFRISSGKPTCPLCRLPFGRADLVTVRQLKTLSSAPTVEEKDKNEENTGMCTVSRGAKTEIFMTEIGSMPKEDKAVAFSQFTKYLDVVEAKLTENGWVRGQHYERLDGTVVHAQRGIILSQFQEDAELRLLLVSLKAGGAGLNLTSACRVLMLDCWWNCAVEEQAQDRVHRIGQTKDVRIVRLIADSSIEELILDLHERKQILSKSAMSRLSPAEQRKALLNRLIRLFEYDTTGRVREANERDDERSASR